LGGLFYYLVTETECELCLDKLTEAESRVNKVSTVAVFDQVEKKYRLGHFRQTWNTALQGVSFTIPAGGVFGLLGPNRAGKTTLIKLLLSLATPSSGNIIRLGEPLSNRRTLARIGYMHENHAFPKYLPAAELLAFYGGLSGLSSEIIPTRVHQLLSFVGLSDRSREPIAGFSKGMVQRLGLAQALLTDPDLLILDEPTEGLDLFGRQLLRQVIQNYRAANKTVLLVTHVLTEVEELCDTIAVLVHGRLVYMGALASLVQDPTTGGRRSLETALRMLYEKEVPA
jgi:ABC-2 type transport system ATP-binding protein